MGDGKVSAKLQVAALSELDFPADKAGGPWCPIEPAEASGSLEQEGGAALPCQPGDPSGNSMGGQASRGGVLLAACIHALPDSGPLRTAAEEKGRCRFLFLCFFLFKKTPPAAPERRQGRRMHEAGGVCVTASPCKDTALPSVQTTVHHSRANGCSSLHRPHLPWDWRWLVFSPPAFRPASSPAREPCAQQALSAPSRPPPGRKGSGSRRCLESP